MEQGMQEVRIKRLAAQIALAEGGLSAGSNLGTQEPGGASVTAFTVGVPTFQVVAATMVKPRGSGIFQFNVTVPFTLGSADTTIWSTSAVVNATGVTGGAHSEDWLVYNGTPITVDGGAGALAVGAWSRQMDATTLLATVEMAGLFKSRDLISPQGQAFCLQVMASTLTGKSITPVAGGSFFSFFELP